jgi:hypothetical protein
VKCLVPGGLAVGIDCGEIDHIAARHAGTGEALNCVARRLGIAAVLGAQIDESVAVPLAIEVIGAAAAIKRVTAVTPQQGLIRSASREDVVAAAGEKSLDPLDRRGVGCRRYDG